MRADLRSRIARDASAARARRRGSLGTNAGQSRSLAAILADASFEKNAVIPRALLVAAESIAVQWEEDPMTVSTVRDAAGRRRSPAAMPGYHAGRPPRNKGMRYPADPPTLEELVAVMRQVGSHRHGARLRAVIVVLWRSGLRIQEALALTERDLDPRRGSILVPRGKGGRRREVGMDDWGFEQLRPWLSERQRLPVGPLFSVIDGPTRGRPWSAAWCGGRAGTGANEGSVAGGSRSTR
jgi:integrase